MFPKHWFWLINTYLLDPKHIYSALIYIDIFGYRCIVYLQLNTFK